MTTESRKSVNNTNYSVNWLCYVLAAKGYWNTSNDWFILLLFKVKFIKNNEIMVTTANLIVYCLTDNASEIYILQFPSNRCTPLCNWPFLFPLNLHKVFEPITFITYCIIIFVHRCTVEIFTKYVPSMYNPQHYCPLAYFIHTWITKLTVR